MGPALVLPRPGFLDPLSVDLPTGLDAVRSAPVTLVRDGVERVRAGRPGPLPGWLSDVTQGDAMSREQLCQGLHDACRAVLGATWPRVTAQHKAEFARYALNAAEHGVVGALTMLCSGSRLVDGCWELDAPYQRHVVPAGRGLVLLPTFHWTMAPLIAENAENAETENEGEPVLVVYPAGGGVPIVPGAAGEDALALVLGSTRAHTLRLLSEPLSTSELAGRLGISPGAASMHTAALRQAGLIGTVRNGRAVRHELTALGTLLTNGVGQGHPSAQRCPPRRTDLWGSDARPTGPARWGSEGVGYGAVAKLKAGEGGLGRGWRMSSPCLPGRTRARPPSLFRGAGVRTGASANRRRLTPS
ncbi:winged helix-turn-helix domain-containing protein [Streptomyces sp. NPDC046942]|uniref:winged helix-turn-helix domain-containing protein n=1 Tax=Streptomyces sp. NPDC046942 TaxID=3155137 RepID=UPI00340DB73A